MQKFLAIAAFIIALLLIAGSGPAWAQGATQPKLIVSAQAGYGDTGAYLMGEWLPVRVTLANPPGGASRRVTVRVSTGSASQNTLGYYQQDVDLPAQSRKEVTLYSYSSDFSHRFTVQLYEGDTQIETADATADPYEPPTGMLVAIASSDSSLMNALKGEQLGHLSTPLPQGGPGGYGYLPFLPASSATVAHISLTDIPTLSQALDSLGVIVVDDVDSGALSPEQKESIEGWVARGGMLVVTYRAGGADTLAGFDSLVPVNVSGSRTVTSLSSLSDLVATPLTTMGSATIGNASVKADPAFTASTRVLAMQDGVPVLAIREVGQGHVAYMGASPALPPLKGWDGLLALEKRIFSEHALHMSYGANLRFSPFSQSYGYYGSLMFASYGGMFELPGLELPDVWLVGGFLLLYIIIIGPINFTILRRIRRTELAWFTIPAGVVLFSVIAYMLALGSKGGNLVAIRVNAINTAEGVPVATLEQHFGLFTPLRSTYRFSLDANSAVTEMNPFGYYQTRGTDNSPVSAGGGTTTINNVNIDTWGLRSFVAEHTAVLESPLEADLHIGEGQIVGKVKNRTTGPLQDVAVIRGGAVKYIGYMSPGEEADVVLLVPIVSTVFNNSSPELVLPPPPGVAPNQSMYYSPGYSNASNAAAQREYDRKLNALSVALYPLLDGDPPTDMNVVLVAWGPSPSTRFSVDGSSILSQEQEVNVWASKARVVATQNDQPSLNSDQVPYTVYAPGNSPSLLPMGGSSSQAYTSQSNGSSTMFLLPPGQVPPNQSQSTVPQPLPTVTYGSSLPASGLFLTPYIDFYYRLPAGAQPQSLYLNFTTSNTGRPQPGSPLDVEAYNVQTGTWDNIATINSVSDVLQQTIPSPTQYVGPAGDVTIRLSSPDRTDININGTFHLALNSDK
ncbi:MAG TPA: hypothetical protein VLQ48_06090 [Chloroflexia bacterium]|nr:hypothetical protein [Chloroflexia bacterium]